ncbi:MAG: class I SAM-dependent methyltransferase [Gemmatimonadota bacterium]
MTALDRWRNQLEAWAIPEPIVAAAAESPYGFPTALFRNRGELGADAGADPTALRALEAVPHGGRVLDVGCGGGATSLPLAGRAGVVVGVDAQEDMLDGFLANARAAGVGAEVVHGRWPDVADRVAPVDVAVAGHVLYNVPSLEPFARALLRVTRSRVVLELTEHHPLLWMNDLWLRFHGLQRPDGPTVDDAVAALAELGTRPTVDRWRAPPRPGGFERRADAVALVRRRLCLSPELDEEIGEALGDRLRRREDLWGAGPADRGLATIWFDLTPRAARP